jgi:hypothetical protein
MTGFHQLLSLQLTGPLPPTRRKRSLRQTALSRTRRTVMQDKKKKKKNSLGKKDLK